MDCFMSGTLICVTLCAGLAGNSDGLLFNEKLAETTAPHRSKFVDRRGYLAV